MKHLFTFLAGVSFLICLFFVALTVMTFSSEKVIDLGERGDRTYSFKADSLEFTYSGKLATFDDKLGFETTKKDVLGCEYDVQNRKESTEADVKSGRAKKAIPAGTGFIFVMPALYPIAIFAILPLVWVVGAMRGKKKVAAPEAEGDEAGKKA